MTIFWALLDMKVIGDLDGDVEYNNWIYLSENNDKKIIPIIANSGFWCLED
jgi:hypothetical protein